MVVDSLLCCSFSSSAPVQRKRSTAICSVRKQKKVVEGKERADITNPLMRSNTERAEHRITCVHILADSIPKSLSSGTMKHVFTH